MFISRHLYNFIVEDEPQIPAWNIEPPKNPDAIDAMISVLMENNGELKPLLRFMFNSDFFKSILCRYRGLFLAKTIFKF